MSVFIYLYFKYIWTENVIIKLQDEPIDGRKGIKYIDALKLSDTTRTYSCTFCFWLNLRSMSNMQETIDSSDKPKFTENPEGNCSIETYTVVHSRKGPEKGIIIGRLEDGKRFLANTEKEAGILEYMNKEDMLNARGVVSSDGKRNIFRLNY